MCRLCQGGRSAPPSRADISNNFGIQGKMPWSDYYATRQDQYNWGRQGWPGIAPLLLKTALVAPAERTTPPIIWLTVNQPGFNLPMGAVLKAGGQQPDYPSIQMIQEASAQARASDILARSLAMNVPRLAY